jgi:hypothetical protein
MTYLPPVKEEKPSAIVGTSSTVAVKPRQPDAKTLRKCLRDVMNNGTLLNRSFDLVSIEIRS